MNVSKKFTAAKRRKKKKLEGEGREGGCEAERKRTENREMEMEHLFVLTTNWLNYLKNEKSLSTASTDTSTLTH